MRDLIIKKCEKCGAMVEVYNDCTCENCGIQCCGEQMKEINTNNDINNPLKYIIVGNYIEVSIDAPDEKREHIEWLAIVGDSINAKKYFSSNKNPMAVFPYIKGAKIYAMCGLHGLICKKVF